MSYAKATYQRYQILYKQHSISRDQYDEAETNLRVKRSQIVNAKHALSHDKKELQDTILTAPFSGSITMRHVNVAEHISANTPIYDMQNPKQWEIDLALPENVINDLSLKSRCTVTVAALPKQQLTAQVKFIGKRATQSHTYPVTLSLQHCALPVKAGMSAKVDCQISPTDKHALVRYQIPVTALGSKNAQHYFVYQYLAQSQTIQAIPVLLHDITHGTATISGKTLQTGMVLIKGGLHVLHSGQKVTLTQPNAD